MNFSEALDAARGVASDEGFEGTGNLKDLGTEGVDWSYGTPELPESPATPATEPEVSNRSIVGDDTRTQVIGTPVGRNAKIGYIEQSNATGPPLAWCTGAMVSANYMLTAGHCVHQSAWGGWAPYITVFVSYNNSGAGIRCAATEKWAGADWVSNEEPNADWGLLKLSCKAGATYGYFGLALNDEPSYYNGKTVRVIGYPEDKPQFSMWSATGVISSSTSTTLGHQVDTRPGQSGGPMLLTDTAIAGIHTQGYPNLYWLYYNFGVRMTGPLKNTLDALIFRG
jgi:glutamyl endopeptidase